MGNNRKWQIPSGAFLEDILYENFKDHHVELAVHSWVVDTSDPQVELCFGTGDWKAICDQIPPLPETDPLLVQSMRRFMNVIEAFNLLSSPNSKSLTLPNVVGKSSRAPERCIHDLVSGERRII